MGIASKRAAGLVRYVTYLYALQKPRLKGNLKSRMYCGKVWATDAGLNDAWPLPIDSGPTQIKSLIARSSWADTRLKVPGVTFGQAHFGVGAPAINFQVQVQVPPFLTLLAPITNPASKRMCKLALHNYVEPSRSAFNLLCDVCLAQHPTI